MTEYCEERPGQQPPAYNFREERLRQQLLACNFPEENICILDRYDSCISEKVLSILLEWACYGQNAAGIMMGRKKIAEIPREWLKTHLPGVVRRDFEYSDYWNYRRLLEVVIEVVPELKDTILSINSETADEDLIEIINDFK